MPIQEISESIKWNPKLCKQCSLCVLMCPAKTLELKEGQMAEKGKCVKCGTCEKFCPDFAIEVIRK